MYLVDYHIHSSCSFDCEFTMLEMAKAAYKRDIKELCFTDHLEVTGELGMLIGPEEFELPEKQAKQYAACLESAPIDMKIGLGLELEHIGDDPARAKRIYGMPEYDFVLGAVHRLRGYEDFYFINYLNREQCFDLLDKYLDELIEMVEIGAFDSVAHIGYCARYMYRDKINVTLEYHDFPEKIDALLGLMIEKGKGIELNCSNLFEREFLVVVEGNDKTFPFRKRVDCLGQNAFHFLPRHVVLGIVARPVFNHLAQAEISIILPFTARPNFVE